MFDIAPEPALEEFTISVDDIDIVPSIIQDTTIGAGVEEQAWLNIGIDWADIWGGVKNILADIWQEGGKDIVIDWLRREVLGDDKKVVISLPTSTTSRTTSVPSVKPPAYPSYQPQYVSYIPRTIYQPYYQPIQYPQTYYAPYIPQTQQYPYTTQYRYDDGGDFLSQILKKPEYLLLGFLILALLLRR